ncbi:5-methyltetrahydropteroyltriglutamate--homocysteine S-methyltransferase [Tsukamurella tyrosinosolvens]|uniref:5-methyltetrahydropteroyltriglutamate-- homocysteine S-methyltransferase n=1 Tax=Tsukamurella tyrosinosolvens TaxID=57704 RepID=UPI0007969F94|nr:5-methyltetrahydropteroyltriglutamate--homocysteine S-methyltransferase [Tsukamurella tyrosinosolvens]KXP07118.1 5-methyltetrahydropteroyltriglutamate--homocysteine methyltransferase [Tsukamurella tyrosinosolvens]KZL98319.1 5-methyltetrahydropteroyltriglutamate--homocysteine methyltransferase [Tsukamurella tyrosinosolvens]MCA4994492.1 5-methyltetrahydropteroyltriglutamate--homocysteine S-methyltransferase [Tsukamurella tyrosinosolvens]WEL92515.1 5-methyltetrahydropteroyltriglutamate--homocys
MTAPNFTRTVLGVPRIGPRRELKRVIEGYWKGSITRAELASTAAGLRRDQWARLVAAGLDSVPTNTFSYYDQMLDTAELLGALPPRVAGIEDPLDRYFAAARGTADVAPLEMTKWFDTNYHYLVPEIGPDTAFALHPEKVLGDLGEALAQGVPARPVVVGPITFLVLSKAVDGGADPLARLDDLLPLYRDLLARLASQGAEWVQLDEPVLVSEAGLGLADTAAKVYGELAGAAERPAIVVATYFGSPGPSLDALANTAVEAIAVDLVTEPGTVHAVASVPALRDKLLLAGVVDGRNVWRADLESALANLGTLVGSAGALAVSTSCSLLHVPYTVSAETAPDPTGTEGVRAWLAFAEEKVAEVVVLSRALTEGRPVVAAEFGWSAAVRAARKGDPRLHDYAVRGRLSDIRGAGSSRATAAERAVAQRDRLGLPLLPTTTIGSYPQTGAIRIARADLRAGRIDEIEYVRRMRAEIADVVKLQEDLGIDVLVHGEPERNDMVQYFAERLDGFLVTDSGWVQSYGTRCVRPPILYGDVRRPEPMTVSWIAYAQTLTERPVKGMLTGPVTILAWSFVRDDQPLADTADQVALAIRDETVDLERAGVRIIQVDEPALRELLPLRAADRPAYLDWATGSFRLSTSGVEDDTQIHTHLCYSEFGDVIGAIADLDADVTSIEAARSRMEILDDLNRAGFANQVGPGVYDIHSPRVPAQDEVEASLRAALEAVPAERLWVNPDCGLKTRGTEETVASLRRMVAAAEAVRASL